MLRYFFLFFLSFCPCACMCGQKVLQALMEEGAVTAAGREATALLSQLLTMEPGRRPSARALLEAPPLRHISPKETYMKAWGRSWAGGR